MPESLSSVTLFLQDKNAIDSVCSPKSKILTEVGLIYAAPASIFQSWLCCPLERGEKGVIAHYRGVITQSRCFIFGSSAVLYINSTWRVMVKYLYDGLLQNKSIYAHPAFHQPYNAEMEKVRNPRCEKKNLWT